MIQPKSQLKEEGEESQKLQFQMIFKLVGKLKTIIYFLVNYIKFIVFMVKMLFIYNTLKPNKSILFVFDLSYFILVMFVYLNFIEEVD